MMGMRERFWRGFVLGLLVGAGLVLAAPWLAERQADWRVPVVALHPEVAAHNVGLRLTNRDRFGWENVQLRLNGRAPEEGYAFHLARLPAGAQVEFALVSFTAPDGAPFDPRTTKGFLLSLWAETPQGQGAWSGRID
jgi:hypothetical protein